MAYIERESAIKSLLNDCLGQVSYSREDAADCIRYMDTADVAPVRHGRWIGKNSPYDVNIHICSVCRGQVSILGNKLRVCPNCGAKMDGGGEDA